MSTLPPGPFVTVVADPPWSYRDRVNASRVRGVKVANYGMGADKIRGRRGAEGYYPVMETDDILSMSVKSCVAQNAHLYLWCTNAFVEQAHQIARGWGFEPRTLLTWVKQGIGMGYFFRNNTEHVVFAVRGSLRTKRRDMPTALHMPKSRVHSQKPALFYSLVEEMSPGPYLELFARKTRPGWMQWGNQVGALDQTTPLFQEAK